jgi:cell division protein FtsQ
VLARAPAGRAPAAAAARSARAPLDLEAALAPLWARRRWCARSVLCGLAAVSAALVFLAVAALGRPVAPRAPLVARLEGLLEGLGGGLDQVEVTGLRFTSGAQILDAVALADARTLLSFDSAAAQARIEQLPFIASAEIERVFPNRLVVRVRERTPIAVWELNGEHWLIDAGGRVLSAIKRGAVPGLPRLKGEGAAREGRALLDALSLHPKLAKQLAFAERIGGRRWTLQFESGDRIQLPAGGVDAALAVAERVPTAAGVARELDLRVAGRLLVRPASAKPQRAEALAGGERAEAPGPALPTSQRTPAGRI